MSKVLLLGINARWTHTNLALFYLRQCIDTQKHSVQILERIINDYVWDILREINEVAPDILCLSCYIWNQSHIQAILRDVKKLLPNLIIVCGGPDISYNAQDWTENYPSIDFIIQGSGEKAFEMLANQDFIHPDKIINIPNHNLSDIALPYSSTDRANLQNRYVYYEASRGCPFHCTFCISSNKDQTLQYKTFEQVKSELDFLLAFEPIIIKFIDRTFNVYNELAVSIWKFLAGVKTETKFHFEIHPNYITDEQIEVLKSIPEGRFQFEIGIQTTKAETLKLIDRDSTPFREGVGMVLQNLSSLPHIYQHLDLIAGLPNETISDIKTSFNEMIIMKPDHFQLGFLKILPGTKIATEIDKWGYKYQETAPYRVFSSNTISAAELYQVELVELALDMIYNSHLMSTLVNTILEIDIDYFEYFLSIGLHFREQNINKAVTDKKRIFQSVAKHLKQYILFSTHYSFLSDCLTYDWFLGVNTHFYPDFLDAKQCDTFKEDIYMPFKEAWQGNDTCQKKPKLRNAIYFTPKSDNFRAQIFSNADGAIRIDNQLIYYIYKKDDNINICHKCLGSSHT